MRFQVLASILAVSSLAYVGCASHTDEQVVSDTNEALSAAVLVGAYNVEPGFSADFAHLVLRADGSFLSEKDIVCFRAPCINPREEGTWKSSSFHNTTLGTLTLRPHGAGSKSYHVSIAGDNSGMKLERYNVVAGFDRVKTYCDSISDCAGQPVPVNTQACMIGNSHQEFCADHACIVKCAPTPECTVDADCRLFDDYCTGCDCRSLGSSTPNPTCAGPGVRCLREPCGGKTAACTAGKCVVR